MASDRLARAVLFASALAFAGPGLGFLLEPDCFGAAVDLMPLSHTAASDVRSVLGGLEVGIAAWLALAGVRARPIAAAFSVQRFALGGMIAGRIASLVVDGAPGVLGWALFSIETLLFAAGWVVRRGASE